MLGIQEYKDPGNGLGLRAPRREKEHEYKDPGMNVPTVFLEFPFWDLH